MLNNHHPINNNHPILILKTQTLMTIMIETCINVHSKMLGVQNTRLSSVCLKLTAQIDYL